MNRVNNYKLLTARLRLGDKSDSAPFNKLHDKIFTSNPAMLGEKKDVEQNLQLTKGSSAPLAYTGKKVFPDNYRPYSFNYFGDGFLIVGFFALSFAAYIMYKQTLLEQGRRHFVNHRDEHWYFNSINYRKNEEYKKRSIDIPIYNYTRRYIKESGF